MIDIEKPAVKSVQEPVDEKQEKELANTENIFAKGEGWGTRNGRFGFPTTAEAMGHQACLPWRGT
jgi:hypothetical protein